LPNSIASFYLKTSDPSIIAGNLFSLTASLYDKYGNPANNSSDTITLTSSDSKASLPSPYKLSSSDNGIHIFQNTILKTAGNQTITASVQSSGSNSVSFKAETTITVKPSIFSLAASTFTTTKDKLVVGKDKATLKATLLDDFGNGLEGKDISISFNSDFGDIKIPLSKTDTTGSATFEYTGKKEGKITLAVFNKTDNVQIGNTITLEILSDTLINNVISLFDTLQDSLIAKNITKVTEPLAAATTALGLLPLIANIIGSAPAAVHGVAYSISLALEALGIRKRRKTWGRVYDSTTGKGLDMAMVRLFKKDSMKLVSTIITDIKGRYNFQPEPGVYVLSVSKDNYIYPTQIFAKYGIQKAEKNTSNVTTHYLGQPINITEKDEHLNIEIPIDPTKKTISTYLKTKIYLQDSLDLSTYALSYIFLPALTLGLIASVFTSVIIPNSKNITLAIVYAVITLIYIISKVIKSSRYGTVIDRKTNKPIAGVVISIFDKKYNTLKETRITDRYGRYSIMAQPGTYDLKAEKEGYTLITKPTKAKTKTKTKVKNIYTGEQFTLKDTGFVKYSMVMEEE
jgi:hypothetical protein